MSPGVRLAAQIGRVPSMVLPLDGRDQTRFERLMADLLMIELGREVVRRMNAAGMLIDLCLLMQPDPRALAPPAAHLNGLESPADGANLIRGLSARGYSDAAIRRIAGLNALDLLRHVIG